MRNKAVAREKKSTNGITTQTAMNTKSNCSRVLIETEEVTRGIVFVRRREDARNFPKHCVNEAFCSSIFRKAKWHKLNVTMPDKLKSGIVTVLVATDVAARGIDIDDVSHVMNFDCPIWRILIYIELDVPHELAEGTAVSFVEAHDYSYLVKSNVIQEEILKRAHFSRFREPRTKPPKDGEVNSLKKQKARIKEKT